MASEAKHLDLSPEPDALDTPKDESRTDWDRALDNLTTREPSAVCDLAFDELHRSVYGVIRSLLRRSTRFNDGDVEDLVQDVFVVLIDRYSDLDEDKLNELPGWLIGVAINKVRGKLTKRERRARIWRTFGHQEQLHWGQDDDERRRKVEASLAVEQLLAALPMEFHEFLTLKYLALKPNMTPYTHEEVAEILGVSPSTVTRRNQRLKKALEKLDGDVANAFLGKMETDQ